MKYLLFVFLIMLSGCSMRNYYYTDISGTNVQVEYIDFLTWSKKADIALNLPGGSSVAVGSVMQRMDPNSTKVLSEAIAGAVKLILVP